jgi:hypothetical protein
VLSTGIASNAAIGWLGSSSKGRLPVVTSHEGTHMLDPQKTLEGEALLRRHRELQAEIAQHERNLREGAARLPLEEQLSLKLWRFIEANIPQLAGKLRIEIGSDDTQK